MAYKIDVRVILKDHFKTLVNASTSRPDYRDWTVFLFLPLAIGGILVFNEVYLTGDFVNSIIGGLSIYVGLSLNFIILLFDLSAKEIFKAREKKDVIKETVANISVSIFYSILIIVFSLFSNFCFVKPVGNFLCYFLIIEFIVTLLMILKRVYILLSEQLEVGN